MLMVRERIWNQNSSRKRRKTCNDEIDNSTNEMNKEEHKMECCLQAKANGE